MNDGTTSVWLASAARSRWAFPALALSVAAAALASAWLAHLRIVESLRIESTSQRALVAAADQAMQAQAPPCDPRLAYVQSLPASVSLDKLVLSLQENSKAFGIALLSVSGESHRGGDKALASMVVSIALQGRYAGIKSTLAESLSRFPMGVIQVIHVKRAAGVSPPVEDASIQVAFPLRPAVLGTAECRLPSASQVTEAHQ
jgi:hypothetical protein